MDFQGMLGFHAKMYLLPWRKSTSALSYLEESAVPIRTFLPSKLLGSKRTSLGPSTDSNDPDDLFASGASSTTFSLRVASSLEAMTAFDLALVSTLEGGADGDDPAGARHLQL